MSAVRKFFSIGLTGGIASGKSSCRKMLRDAHGALVIDADKLGHACYVPGHPCLEQVLESFGRENLLDGEGTLDRAKLGGIVFSDPLQLQKLNGIVWPHIRTALERQLMDLRTEAEAQTADAAAGTATTIVVVEAAVLFEAAWEDLFDEVWVVYVDPTVACERLMARNNLSAAEATKRQQAQMSNTERLQKCHVHIENNRTTEIFEKAVHKEWAKCKVRASGVGLCANEMLTIVDPENNTVIGEAKRSVVKASRDLCYRATYIFVRQTNSELLYVQRRSDLKDYCPSELDPVFGGCVGAGESYEENAVRELKEELGVDGAALEHLFVFKYEGDAATGQIWGSVYETEINVPVEALNVQPEEVEAVYLMAPEELVALDDARNESTLSTDCVTRDSMVALRMYMERRRGEDGKTSKSKY